MIRMPSSTTNANGSRSLASRSFYHSLYTKLARLSGGHGIQIGFTSATRGEGVSTITANLAIAAAETSEEPTLYIDANFANPGGQQLLGLPRAVGFADILAGAATPDCLQTTSISGLTAIAAGTPAARKESLVSLAAWKVLLEGLSEKFTNILVDVPPPSESPNCNAICSQLTGAVLVVEAETVRRQVVSNAKQQLVDGGTEILGAVFNKRRNHVPGWIYRRL